MLNLFDLDWHYVTASIPSSEPGQGIIELMISIQLDSFINKRKFTVYLSHRTRPKISNTSPISNNYMDMCVIKRIILISVFTPKICLAIQGKK